MNLTEFHMNSFIKSEQFGASVDKKFMFRVTKDLIPVLKGPGGRGRTPGCIKLLGGNFELWCQNKRLLEIDTEAIKYDKMDMS